MTTPHSANIVLRVYGALLIALSFVLLMACAFPGVAIDWTTAQQWFALGSITLGASIGTILVALSTN